MIVGKNDYNHHMFRDWNIKKEKKEEEATRV